AIWSYRAGYASAVLQAGERNDNNFIDMIERILIAIKKQTNSKLRITLSLGEQSYDTYQRWFNAGAHRYLLRIESSNPTLFSKIHPKNHLHSFDYRVKCLHFLQKIGYQVGTGVMIGLPFQTIEDLANDILFFKNNDIDMIGMGPFIYHSQTPLNHFRNNWQIPNKDLLNLALRMIATTRIVLKNVNIAATTALQALHNNGREFAIKAGANIIMPNTTQTQYRSSYQLYENKPCTDENASMCRGCLEKRIQLIGENIVYNQWGDSKHFQQKKSLNKIKNLPH
ncbi:MAG: [FeFe] hydrogenase H-cluster radical SAM maturase HydE, partial [Lentisphaeria bacterium]